MKSAIFLILYFLIIIPVQAEFITGGVELSVDSAREEVLANTPDLPVRVEICIGNTDSNFYENKSNLLKGVTSMKDRKLGKFSDGSYAVMFYDNPRKTYYYSQSGDLLYTEIKTDTKYPYKAFKYRSDGSLVNRSLKVSPTETFIFSVSGKLIAHWVGEKCLDENGNVIMTRKIYE